MKAVILAGGLGTRLSEETHLKPKPMVEVGQRPILWHIMKYFSCFGVNEFIICLGYKGYIIKEYFSNIVLHNSDVTFDIESGEMELHDNRSEPWKVTLVDTGEKTLTGGRLKKASKYFQEETEIFFTYGDGLTNVNISKLYDFHQSHKRKATVTAVRPPGRFGSLEISQEKQVTKFLEKPLGDGGYINGGFFVLSTDVLEYINDDMVSWENYPMNKLVSEKQLAAYKHDGFWHPMDTARDMHLLNDLWQNDKAPWKLW